MGRILAAFRILPIFQGFGYRDRSYRVIREAILRLGLMAKWGPA